MKRKLFIIGIVVGFSVFGVSNSQPTIRPGWGVEFDLSLGFVRQSLVNWTLDSKDQVVISAISADRIALFHLNGDTLPGWPTTETEDWWTWSGPRLGDVTGDGEINVVMMMRSYWANHAQLRVYDLDGTLRDEFTCSRWDFVQSNVGEVVLYDLDDDGVQNVIYAIDSLYAADNTGAMLPGFPRRLCGERRWEGLVVIPDILYPGKAIISSTHDSIQVESVATLESLPGWPRPYPNTTSIPSRPLVVPYNNSWAVAMHTNDSLYAWDDQGELLNGFPLMLNRPLSQCRNFGATDIDLDGTPEFALQKASGETFVVSLEGEMLPGFPWNADRTYKGFGEDVISLHVLGEDSARLFVTADLRIGEENQYHHGLMSLEGSTPADGYPIYNDRIEANYFPTCGVIWTEQSDTLHILHMAPYGYLTVFDLPLPGASVRLIWPVPGGNAAGNRVYMPSPYLSVEERSEQSREPLPPTPSIRRCYPNPTNGGVRIEYVSSSPREAGLQIYDLLGRLVWSTSVTGAGRQAIHWPGTDSRGNTLPSGRYFVRLEGSSSYSQVITLLR